MTYRNVVRRILFYLRGRVVHLHPKGRPRGNVLLSYTTLPFLDPNPQILEGHTNRWECLAMAHSFLSRGYAVDVIDFTNNTFIPKKSYTFCIDVDTNLERLAPLLNKECVKIFHATTSHWRFNNKMELMRLDNLEVCRGVRLPEERVLIPTHSAEVADIILLLGNTQTESTYAHLHKPTFRIPISTTFTYPSPKSKNIDAARHSFVWIGGAGLVHKGVDLLLEAFATMPEYELHLCGKTNDAAFMSVYAEELSLPNIHTHGLLNLGDKQFADIATRSIAVISPSCAEGQSGAVIVGMHAGLIPIASKESGIDTGTYGTTLEITDVARIRQAVQTYATLPTESLHIQAVKTWEYAQEHHTREVFSRTFSDFVDLLEKQHHTFTSSGHSDDLRVY